MRKRALLTIEERRASRCSRDQPIHRSPGGDLPGGGPEAQAGERGLPGPGDVAELGSGKSLVGEVVIALDEVVYVKRPVTFLCNSRLLQ